MVQPQSRAPFGDDSGAGRALRVFHDACSDFDVAAGETVLVALSGGLDSTVLLHLMRFHWPGDARPHVVAAHLDHRMRAGSARDACWVRGLCAAWGVHLLEDRVVTPPSGEAEARTRRYAFLRGSAEELRARTIVTGHHADDQAETVLFRMLRGTGPDGLRGIRAERADGVWRPLLRAWRDDLEAYARQHGLAWREDPSNDDVGYARNALRHRILPEAERLVAPGGRRALVRFAERAVEDEDGWESLMPDLVAGLSPDREARLVRFDRCALGTLHPAVRARVLRALAGELGVTLGSRATGMAVAFSGAADSGRRIDLGDGLVLARELQHLVFSRSPRTPEPDRILTISGPDAGQGEVRLAGRTAWVGWGAAALERARRVERFLGDELRYPLTVRGWNDGDRMRIPRGTRKLKQLFLEARIPAPERRRLPVLADADGEILWIPGVARSVVAQPAPAQRPGTGFETPFLHPIGIA